MRFSTSWLIPFAILLLAGGPEDNGGDARSWQVVASENPAALVSGWGTSAFTDVHDPCVRAISPTGTIRPVVGGLYVADTGNSVIRKGHLP